MKILILCERLDIDLTSSGVGRSKLLRCLGQTNYDIHCLFDQFKVSDVNSISGISFYRLNKEKASFRFKPFRAIGKLNALHHYLFGFNGDLMQQIFWWKEHLEDILAKDKFDFIFVLGTGQQLSPFFALYLVQTEIPFVLNFHDPYPEALHPEFKRPVDFVFRRRIKTISNLIDKAFKITTPSMLLLTELKKHYPVGDKGVVLPHPGISSNSAENISEAHILKISHTGLLLGSRNPKVFLRVVRDWINENPTYKNKIKISHNGPVKYQDPELDQLIFELRDILDFSTDRISYQDSLIIQQQADVLLLVDFNNETSPIMLGKLADYFANLKPIFALTPDNSETSRLLGADYALKSPSSDYERIKMAFELLIETWNKKQLDSYRRKDLKAYVGCENIKTIFENKIVADLKKEQKF